MADASGVESLVARPPPVFGSKWGAPTPLVARPETLSWWEVEVEDMFWCGVGLESAVGRGPAGPLNKSHKSLKSLTS